jgi:hypothetical protein
MDTFNNELWQNSKEGLEHEIERIMPKRKTKIKIRKDVNRKKEKFWSLEKTEKDGETWLLDDPHKVLTSEDTKKKKKLNSVACSPRANYTDQAAAAC